MRAALDAATIFLVGCGASIPKPAPPASAGASRSPGDAAAFPRGYDAISYSLELSLLDPDGSIDGLLVVEVVARRSALTEVDLDAVGLEILGVTERGAPMQSTLEGGHLRVVLEFAGRVR